MDSINKPDEHKLFMKAKANEAKERKMKALADLAEGGGEFVIPEKDTSIKL